MRYIPGSRFPARPLLSAHYMYIHTRHKTDDIIQVTIVPNDNSETDKTVDIIAYNSTWQFYFI